MTYLHTIKGVRYVVSQNNPLAMRLPKRLWHAERLAPNPDYIGNFKRLDDASAAIIKDAEEL